MWPSACGLADPGQGSPSLSRLLALTPSTDVSLPPFFADSAAFFPLVCGVVWCVVCGVVCVVSCLARHLEAFEPHIRYELAWVDNDSVGPPLPPIHTLCAHKAPSCARAHGQGIPVLRLYSRVHAGVACSKTFEATGVWGMAGVEREEEQAGALSLSRNWLWLTSNLLGGAGARGTRSLPRL